MAISGIKSKNIFFSDNISIWNLQYKKHLEFSNCDTSYAPQQNKPQPLIPPPHSRASLSPEKTKSIFRRNRYMKQKRHGYTIFSDKEL